MRSESEQTTSSGFMDSIVRSTPRFIRGILLLAILGFGIFEIISLLLQKIYSNGNIDIEVNEKGGIVFKVANGSASDKSLVALLLPASDTWMDTGLDLEPGDKCEFKVTGNVHLALNSLSTSVSKNKIPSIDWTGPNGNPWATIGDNPECLKAKKSLLLLPGDIIGNVVGYAYSGKTSLSKDGFIDYFMKNRDAIRNSIFSIGSEGSYPNSSEVKQRLFLSVNDILIDTTSNERKAQSKLAYEGRVNHPDVQKWDSLVQNSKYYRLWFNDNIGGFLVSVTITHKKK